MKKIIFSTAVILLSASAFSQNVSVMDWNPELYKVGQIYPGHVITLQGDTLKGFIKGDVRCAVGGLGTSHQNQAVFYINETDKKPTAKYKPADIKGYKVADRVYESINYSGGLFKKPNFNIVLVSGAISIYEWYATNENYSSITRMKNESLEDFDARRYVNKLIIAKVPTDPIDYSIVSMSFAKRMTPLFADNEEIARKVSEGEEGYTFTKIFQIIKEYNTWSAKNK